MNDPAGDRGFLHDLEHTVREELATAERAEQAGDIPFDQWLFDPADVLREEIGLRSLLGAVEAAEGRDAAGQDGIR